MVNGMHAPGESPNGSCFCEEFHWARKSHIDDPGVLQYVIGRGIHRFQRFGSLVAINFERKSGDENSYY